MVVAVIGVGVVGIARSDTTKVVSCVIDEGELSVGGGVALRVIAKTAVSAVKADRI